jgi:hypothetical protein
MKLLELPPYAELSTAELVRQTLKWQCVGLAMLVGHVIMSKLSAVPFFPIALLVLGWLYYKAPLAGLLVFFQWLIYQNWVLSILSVGMDYSTFTMLQGSSFAALVLMAGISFTRLVSSKRWRHLDGRLLGAVKLALLMSCIYAVYGMTKAGITPTAVYFREATSLVLAVPIGLDVGRVWGYRTVGTGFLVSAALSIVISLVEISAPAPYYDLINAPNYTNLKYSKVGSSVKDPASINSVRTGKELAEANSAVFFNITGSETTSRSFRFIGTVIHPISYAYRGRTMVMAPVAFTGDDRRQGREFAIRVQPIAVDGLEPYAESEFPADVRLHYDGRLCCIWTVFRDGPRRLPCDRLYGRSPRATG